MGRGGWVLVDAAEPRVRTLDIEIRSSGPDAFLVNWDHQTALLREALGD
jgi:hypothetical protein